MSSFTIPASAYNTFPATPKYSFSLKRTSRWKNLTQRSASDIRTAVGFGSYPVYTWEINYKLIKSDSSATLQTVMGFYNQQNGQLTPFNFPDPEDYAATACQFSVGDGSSKTFQLYRLFGGYFEPVLAPYGTAKVFVNGVEKTATTDFTISSAGLVTFTSAPANGTLLTWTGTYYWICAFNVDECEFENFANDKWLVSKLTFESLKKASLS